MAGVIPIIGMGIDIGICAAIGIGICIAVGIRIVAFMIFSWVVVEVGLLGLLLGCSASLVPTIAFQRRISIHNSLF